MTFRGVYKNGVVVLSGGSKLAEGTPVDVTPRTRTTKSRAKSPKAAKAKAARKLPGFGIWKDRWPESMRTEDIARDLRAKAMRRGVYAHI